MLREENCVEIYVRNLVQPVTTLMKFIINNRGMFKKKLVRCMFKTQILSLQINFELKNPS